jgi:hypothetical protein
MPDAVSLPEETLSMLQWSIGSSSTHRWFLVCSYPAQV